MARLGSDLQSVRVTERRNWVDGPPHELMRELREAYTIVIVTHNMQQAARVSDVTAFFTMAEDRAGYLVEVGPTGRIFTRPNERLTEDYISGRFG